MRVNIFRVYNFLMAHSGCTAFIKQNIRSVLSYSGHSYDSYGQYQQCLSLRQSFKYLYVTLEKTNYPVNKATYIGLCLPSICDNSFIQSQLNILFQQLNQPTTVTKITNSDQFYYASYNWAFYLTIILLFILIVLFFLATFNKNAQSIQMFGFHSIKKNFQVNQKNNLNVFNGIKAISMIWIVLRHTFKIGFIGTINSHSRQRIQNHFFFLIIDAGLFAVDVFFFLGGFLISYAVIKKISDCKSCFKNIVHRAFRLWPAYIFSILFFYSFYLHMGKGPFWGKDQQLVSQCLQKLYKTLFFVDNLWGRCACIGWTWYLHCDMQLYTISLFILLLYKSNQKAAKVLIWILIAISLITSIIFVIMFQTVVVIRQEDQLAWEFYFIFQYIKPYARFPSYLFGVFIGMLYLQYSGIKKTENDQVQQEKCNFNFVHWQKTFKTKRSYRLATQLVGIVIILFIIFIPVILQHGYQWPAAIHAIYLSTSKLVFAFGLFLAIVPTMLGCKQSFVRFLTDSSVLSFIGKISFCTYLVHQIFVDALFRGKKYDSYYSITDKFVQFCALLIISLFFGMLITVLVQFPFSKIITTIISSNDKEVKKESIELSKLEFAQTQKIQKAGTIRAQIVTELNLIPIENSNSELKGTGNKDQ